MKGASEASTQPSQEHGPQILLELFPRVCGDWASCRPTERPRALGEGLYASATELVPIIAG